MAAAVIAYASNIDNLSVLGPAVKLMSNKHCGLQVQPEHYTIVENNMMLSIAEILGDSVTEEIASGWQESLQFLSRVLIENEDAMYKQAAARSGGWTGWKQFSVGKQDIAQDTVLLTFTADEPQPIDFTPGQFLTIRVDGVESPRHYTIVSTPGAKYLQCAVKNINGEMSN